MPSNKRPRKAYKPPARRVIRPMTIGLDHSAATMLQITPHQALADIRLATNNATNWHTLAERVNFGVMLANRIDSEPLPELNEALDSLRAMKVRFEDTGKLFFLPAESMNIGQAIGIVDQLQRLSTRRELRDALTATDAANDKALAKQRKGN